jgi:hypothetical protein
MVSSLPFLAPLILRKAREYKSKQSSNDGYGSGNRRSRKVKGDGYKLDSISHSTEDKGIFGSSANSARVHASKTQAENSDEEEILGHGHIVKSVTYAVQTADAEIASTKETPGALQR